MEQTQVVTELMIAIESWSRLFCMCILSEPNCPNCLNRCHDFPRKWLCLRKLVSSCSYYPLRARRNVGYDNRFFHDKNIILDTVIFINNCPRSIMIQFFNSTIFIYETMYVILYNSFNNLCNPFIDNNHRIRRES